MSWRSGRWQRWHIGHRLWHWLWRLNLLSIRCIASATRATARRHRQLACTLNAQWQCAPAQAVAGSALTAFGPRLLLPSDGPRLPSEHNRAAALLRLAVQAVADGVGVDASAALPMYLRDKVAQTTAERERAKAGAVA